ncbi:MAG: hypothetical protein ABIQ41_11475 [Gemmatimonadales bacterium]
MPVLRLLLRILGWLLTPLVASAASFLGAVLGTVVAEWIESPTVGLVVTVGLGAATGAVVLVFWFRLLRHHPKLSHALDLESTVESPIVALAAAEPGSPPVVDHDSPGPTAAP